MTITGHLSGPAVRRFTGAIGWVLTRADVVLVDIIGLQGWSDTGREAILSAAERLTVYEQTLELAGPAPADGDLPGISRYPDLPTALRAHGITNHTDAASAIP